MKSNAELKMEAKQTLANNSSLYGYSLILLAVSMITSFLPFLSFFSTLLIWVFALQFVKVCMDAIENKHLDLLDFTQTLKAVQTCLWTIFYCWPGIIMSFIGGLFLFYSSIGLVYEETFIMSNYLILSLGIILVIIGSIIYIIQGYSYCLSFYMAFDSRYDIFTAQECVKESKKIMNGHKMDYFILCLSFILWFILGSFTCGLAYIYVFPYYYLTLCNFYYMLTKSNNIEDNEIYKEPLI